MADLRAAAQAVIEQLKHGWVSESDPVAIALRAALAQEEQEPVAWMRPDETLCVVREVAEAEGYQPLYTHPLRREWKGLSENELGELMRDSCGYPMCPNGDDLAFAHAIEQALKERNHG